MTGDGSSDTDEFWVWIEHDRSISNSGRLSLAFLSAIWPGRRNSVNPVGIFVCVSVSK